MMLGAFCLAIEIFCHQGEDHHYRAKMDLSHPAVEHNLKAPHDKPVLTQSVNWDPDCKVSPKLEYKKLYVAAAQKNPSLFTPCLLARQGQAESNFDPNAVSPAGAKGIAQIVDNTAEQYGIDPFDPEQAIQVQASYMRWCQELWTPGLGGRTDFDLRALALSCYNFGRGATLKNQRKYGWVLYAEAEPHLPGETQDYVRKILR